MNILSDVEKRAVAVNLTSFILLKAANFKFEIEVFYKNTDIVFVYNKIHITIYDYGVVVFGEQVDERYEIYDFDNKDELVNKVLAYINLTWLNCTERAIG